MVPYGANLLTANQSSMTTDITGWTNNFNCTVARVTTNFRSSPAAGQATTTTGTNGVCNIVLAGDAPVTVGLTYTLQAWLRLATTTGKFGRCKLSPADASFVDVGPNFVSSDITLTTSYQLVTVSGVIPVGATQAALVIEWETTVNGELALWDDVFLAINMPDTQQRAMQAVKRAAFY